MKYLRYLFACSLLGVGGVCCYYEIWILGIIVIIYAFLVGNKAAYEIFPVVRGSAYKVIDNSKVERKENYQNEKKG